MFADIIIDLSHEQIDRPFSYRVPINLEGQVEIGSRVIIPFGKGNTKRSGYVIGLSDTCSCDQSLVKEIDSISPRGITVENSMILLASWMRREYGCTMIQALKTVMPVKEKVRVYTPRILCLNSDEDTLRKYLEEARRKNYRGQVRILEELKRHGRIPWIVAQKQLKANLAMIKPLEKAGIVRLELQDSGLYRQEMRTAVSQEGSRITLNGEQQDIVRRILESFRNGIRKPCLIHGVTGSGKTEVYIRLIEAMLEQGKESIVLIPEISLTYQTVMRFYSRFGRLVSMVNSRLSPGEKYEQFERAARGEVKIMIGPRSALFTPFANLGLIVIDEEHENAYKSEQVPRYHARETAIARASLCGAVVVMGSATPSMEAYSRAVKGEYRLFELKTRAVRGSRMAEVEVVDLRKELAGGNRSVFSMSLQERMEETLEKGEQAILFLNRRGYSRAVSCRQCGEPVGCPHCAVPLTEHTGKRLVCHYCGYTIPVPARCPSCGSAYLAGFGMGTEKIEQLTAERFKGARILRMDSDTTGGKDGHGAILKQFGNHEADILIGTQMIVKGHDFPDVTLVGILAADMSLYSGDFRSAEKTFQLLTQAAGRAGRGNRKGHVIIQTYSPLQYGIRAAADQCYEEFYEQESSFRRQMAYPPEGEMCEILVAARDRMRAEYWILQIAALIRRSYRNTISVIGPSDAPVAKIRDYWRKHLFAKTGDHNAYRDFLEEAGGLEQTMKKEDVWLSVTSM